MNLLFSGIELTGAGLIKMLVCSVPRAIDEERVFSLNPEKLFTNYPDICNCGPQTRLPTWEHSAL